MIPMHDYFEVIKEQQMIHEGIFDKPREMLGQQIDKGKDWAEDKATKFGKWAENPNNINTSIRTYINPDVRKAATTVGKYGSQVAKTVSPYAKQAATSVGKYASKYLPKKGQLRQAGQFLAKAGKTFGDAMRRSV